MTGDRISNGSEEVPSPRPFLFFVPRREGKCGRVADLFEHEANLGFIPAVGTGLHTLTPPHGPGVLVQQARFNIHQVKS